jgi:endonuclease/exonuclease/phosphatase family metal-dependent hydrolase
MAVRRTFASYKQHYTPIIMHTSKTFNCYLLFIFLLTTLPIYSQTEKNPPIRIISYNIRYNTPADSLNPWRERKNRVASLIKYHKADICGLQEVLKDQLADLERLLPEYKWCGIGRDDGKEAGEFSPIFYNASLFTLINWGTFWLSETPQQPGSKGWDAALPRIVTWAFLLQKSTGVKFYAFNTHFDHMGVAARSNSAHLLLDSVKNKSGEYPVMVTGDFNSTDTSKPHQILCGKDNDAAKILTDALTSSAMPHYGPLSTWNGFHEIEENNRIDFIFVNNHVKVRSHAILTDRWDGKFPSDHLPVIAEIILNDKKIGH